VVAVLLGDLAPSPIDGPYERLLRDRSPAEVTAPGTAQQGGVL
jgi:hypothetical protein